MDDYNDCQLVVDRIHHSGYIEDMADGWTGKFIESVFNGAGRYDFQLNADIPMWYSLQASQDPNLQSQIENLSDSGSLVEVWGTVMIGVPDGWCGAEQPSTLPATRASTTPRMARPQCRTVPCSIAVFS